MGPVATIMTLKQIPFMICLQAVSLRRILPNLSCMCQAAASKFVVTTPPECAYVCLLRIIVVFTFEGGVALAIALFVLCLDRRTCIQNFQPAQACSKADNPSYLGSTHRVLKVAHRRSLSRVTETAFSLAHSGTRTP